MLASASAGETLKLWDVAPGKVTQTFGRHGTSVYCAAFAPDGKALALAGSDKTVRLWDAADGHECVRVTAHTDPVYGVALAPDGKRLASAGEDREVRVWDAVTGKALRHLAASKEALYAVALGRTARCTRQGPTRSSAPSWGRRRPLTLPPLQRGAPRPPRRSQRSGYHSRRWVAALSITLGDDAIIPSPSILERVRNRPMVRRDRATADLPMPVPARCEFRTTAVLFWM